MEPLIKITNIPIAFEMKVNHARLEYNNASADLEKDIRKGGRFCKRLGAQPSNNPLIWLF